MIDEHSRTGVPSHERSPDHEFILSLEKVSDLYAEAGLPRTLRAIQKYCATGKLDARKIEIETGEQWFVALYSVQRHIAYIKEVRTAAASGGLSRPGAAARSEDDLAITLAMPIVNNHEQPPPNATVRIDDRYANLLEGQITFLKNQIEVKDGQIKELTERARETNVLIAGLQKMLGPMLRAPKGDNPEQDL